ncbi:hypothetical protein HRbin41_01361 [bacterium HR41]|nr:hypothetical protein HRbin41_01361 [bacterium HR41]
MARVAQPNSAATASRWVRVAARSVKAGLDSAQVATGVTASAAIASAARVASRRGIAHHQIASAKVRASTAPRDCVRTPAKSAIPVPTNPIAPARADSAGRVVHQTPATAVIAAAPPSAFQ